MIKHKTLTYCGFMVTSLVVILAFVSATTYIQLALAIILYFPLAYFVFKVFPRKAKTKESAITTIKPSSVKNVEAEILKPSKEGWGIADVDKRSFLNLIGGAGLALFLFSIFNKKAESQFFGKASGTTTLQDTAGKKVDPAQLQAGDGFNISEVDDSLIAFYGFTNKEGAWFIMQEDTDAGSFRYARGESDFPGNWVKRQNLKYDYFNNVF